MRVQSINNLYLYNNSLNSSKVSFNGMFGEPDAEDKIQMAINALNEGDVLLYGNDFDIAKNYLISQRDKLGFMTKNFYFVKEDRPDKVDKFALYRINNQFKILNTDHWTLYIKDQKDSSISKSAFLKQGESLILNNGQWIQFGLSSSGPLFQFKMPKGAPQSVDEKYVKKYPYIEDKGSIDEYNRLAIQNLGNVKPNNKINNFKIKFADIGGYNDVKAKLEEDVIFPMKFSDAYNEDRINKGVILYGPPRCGKTMLGLAMANEVDAAFIKIAAHDLTHPHVGQSEQNWRNVFDEAIKKQPAIIFIDEFDAVGKSREGTSMSRNEDGIVSQLLSLMSDIEKNGANVFVIAATNEKKLIDGALLGTGRFGLHIEVPLPDREAVGEIFGIYLKNKKLGDDVSIEGLADLMHSHQFNGSDIAETVSKARKNAMNRLGIYDKMRTNIFKMADLSHLTVDKVDFEKVIEELSLQKSNS